MPPLVTLVAQRHTSDCGVAALAMFAGVSYEEALLALGTVELMVIHKGAWLTQLREAAFHLGLQTRVKAKAHLEFDEGILRLRRNDGTIHFVVLRGGLIYDGDGSKVWKPSTYFEENKAKARNILVKDEWDGEL